MKHKSNKGVRLLVAIAMYAYVHNITIKSELQSLIE